MVALREVVSAIAVRYKDVVRSRHRTVTRLRGGHYCEQSQTDICETSKSMTMSEPFYTASLSLRSNSDEVNILIARNTGRHSKPAVSLSIIVNWHRN